MQHHYKQLMGKYIHLKKRYERLIRANRFKDLSRKQQASIINRLKRYWNRLWTIANRIGGTISLASLALLAPKFANAQLQPQPEPPVVYDLRTCTGAIIKPSSGEAASYAAGDLNNDGAQDMVILDAAQADNEDNNYRIQYYENDGDGLLIQQLGINSPIDFPVFPLADGDYLPSSLAIGDLDGDGDDDLLVGSLSISGEFSTPLEWFENLGGENGFNPTPNPILNTLDVIKFSLGDLDRDGDDDLLFHDGLDRIRYAENDGSGQFEELSGTDNPFAEITTNAEFGSLVLHDVDNDGNQDLIFVDVYFSRDVDSPSDIRYFKNDGFNTFPSASEQTGIDNPWNEADGNVLENFGTAFVADFDGDGEWSLHLSSKKKGVKCLDVPLPPPLEPLQSQDLPVSGPWGKGLLFLMISGLGIQSFRRLKA